MKSAGALEKLRTRRVDVHEFENDREASAHCEEVLACLIRDQRTPLEVSVPAGGDGDGSSI